MKLWIGWDSSELIAWNVAQMSAQTHTTQRLDIRRIAMPELRAKGLYYRPTTQMEHGYWDEISGAPMSTGHAIARFLVPYLSGYSGWAVFTDGDVLFRDDLAALFAQADPQYAVQVVQHQHAPTEAVKMEGQAQTSYYRKNWSSAMLFNCGHLANRNLTVDLVNRVPGRDLHRFCWLRDEEIGALPGRWNHLVGCSTHDEDAAIAHYTLGTPNLKGYERQPFADEWRSTARACGYRLPAPMELADA